MAGPGTQTTTLRKKRRVRVVVYNIFLRVCTLLVVVAAVAGGFIVYMPPIHSTEWRCGLESGGV
jgi:hypothetical protein